jgi:hypothetical protein
MTGDRDFERRLELIERGIREIEAAPDAGLRATAQQLVQAILEMHAASLERLLEIVHGSGEAGQAIIDRLGRDPLVSKLMLLHSLHPVSIEARVLQALDDLRPRLRSQHAEVTLVGIRDATVRVRVTGGVGLESEVERAILDAAPDTAALEIESAPGQPAVVGFVPIQSLRGAERTSPRLPNPALVETRGS